MYERDKRGLGTEICLFFDIYHTYLDSYKLADLSLSFCLWLSLNLSMTGCSKRGCTINSLRDFCLPPNHCLTLPAPEDDNLEKRGPYSSSVTFVGDHAVEAFISAADPRSIRKQAASVQTACSSTDAMIFSSKPHGYFL